MKKKWYLQTWFIGLLFCLWPFIVPFIAAVVLLIMQILHDKKANQLNVALEDELADLRFQKESLTNEVNSLNSKLQELDADSYFAAKEKTDALNNKFSQMEAEFNTESQKNNDVISKLRDEISILESRFEKLSKQTSTQERKLQRSKELYQSVAYAIDNFTVKPFQYSDCKLSTMEFEELDLIAPSITLKLHCMDVKSLRKAYKDTEKQINLQNGKAGNIYIISNLGSFGEDVFKVGMTRRLNPQDRVNELGDASVPFKFDVHSFIFSDDAVSLENKLHTILNDKRVNKVNLRKEFFRISIDELEQLVNEIEPTAEFNKTMLAEEFRQSLSTDQPYTDDYQIIDDESEE